MMSLPRRVLILPLSAVVIAGLCAYKLSQSDETADPDQPIVITRQAPFFELYDQRKPPQLARLKSFMGRHHIVLVFFDAESGLADNPVLAWLREHAEALQSQNVKVFAISSALPQTHRKMLKVILDATEPAPFLMLSDLDGKVHRLYGRLDARTQKFSPGVFLIDRAGNLSWNREHPLPLDDPLPELQREFSIE